MIAPNGIVDEYYGYCPYRGPAKFGPHDPVRSYHKKPRDTTDATGLQPPRPGTNDASRFGQ